MTSCQVRPVVPQDLDQLTELFMICFNAPPWSDGWSRDGASERLGAIAAAPGFRGWLSERDGRAIGLLLGQVERWVADHHFNLLEMCVHSDHQRLGIGGRMLERAERDLRREGVTKLYLITAPGDVAEAFYSKHGFYRSRGRIVMGRSLVL
jgi:ribosomal protein S18 acetylase RimI-like enzyme